jgi:hypothetical protein
MIPVPAITPMVIIFVTVILIVFICTFGYILVDIPFFVASVFQNLPSITAAFIIPTAVLEKDPVVKQAFSGSVNKTRNKCARIG